jgi:hypothetical protein
MSAESIARALNGRRAGGGYVMRCPAHEDNRPSLSISERGGKVLVKCHAGCDQAAVVESLKAKGLWDAPQQTVVSRIDRTYDYTDENGVLLYQVCRLIPKDFRQRAPDGKGGWTWSTKGVRKVLYRLREVLENPIVFLVEGEKDAETLREWGFTATTASGGAKAAWLPQYTAALKGREVILIPDNDAPGWERAKALYRELDGKVSCLRVFDLPEGIKDITEWFESGRSEVEFLVRLEGENVV